MQLNLQSYGITTKLQDKLQEKLPTGFILFYLGWKTASLLLHQEDQHLKSTT